MSSTKSRWVTGCALGCSGIALTAVIAMGIAGLKLREVAGELDAIRTSEQRLVEAHGPPRSYRPAPDGAIPAERIERFLEVRRSLHGARQRIEEAVAEVPFDEARKGSLLDALRIVRSLAGLIDPVTGYIVQRNELLLAADLSLGEYLYVYTIAYYSWLGHLPEDGPLVVIDGREQPLLTGKRADRRHDPDDDGGTFAPPQVRARYRAFALAMLRNQRKRALVEGEANGGTGALVSRLESEIQGVDAEGGTAVWRGALPDSIRASLEPYREPLEASYARSTNPFEFPVQGDPTWRFSR